MPRERGDHRASEGQERKNPLAFLREMWGRPAQSVSVTGVLIHAHTDWRLLDHGQLFPYRIVEEFLTALPIYDT
jgi:hypothetical protein